MNCNHWACKPCENVEEYPSAQKCISQAETNFNDCIIGCDDDTSCFYTCVSDFDDEKERCPCGKKCPEGCPCEQCDDCFKCEDTCLDVEENQDLIAVK